MDDRLLMAYAYAYGYLKGGLKGSYDQQPGIAVLIKQADEALEQIKKEGIFHASTADK